MKGGLARIPGLGDLEKAYASLLHAHPSAPTSDDLALYSQWSRFDPRLAEILVEYIAKNWKRIPPVSLRESLLIQPWPSVAAVLFEFVGAKLKGSHTSKLYAYWAKLITLDFKKAGGEQYFIGLRQLGGKAMLEDAAFPLQAYCRWGYLARENLVSKSTSASLSPQTRTEILKTLFAGERRVRTEQYWQAIGKCVSRRQAERDLRDHPNLRACGRTKGTYFVWRRT